jgi:hypothetical protein
MRIVYDKILDRMKARGFKIDPEYRIWFYNEMAQNETRRLSMFKFYKVYG